MIVTKFLITFIATILTLEYSYQASATITDKGVSPQATTSISKKQTEKIQIRPRLEVNKINVKSLFSSIQRDSSKTAIKTKLIVKHKKKLNLYKKKSIKLKSVKLKEVKLRVKRLHKRTLRASVNTGLNTSRPFNIKPIKKETIKISAWANYLKSFDVVEKFEVAKMVSNLAKEKREEAKNAVQAMTTQNEKAKEDNRTSLLEKLASPSLKETIKDEVTTTDSSLLNEVDLNNDEITFVDINEKLNTTNEVTQLSPTERLEEITTIEDKESKDLTSVIAKTAKLSANVQNVIKQEVKHSVEIAQNQTDNLSNKVDYKNPAQETKKDDAPRGLTSHSYFTDTKVSLLGVSSQGVLDDLHSFDFIPSYDLNERLGSNVSGELIISEEMSSQSSLMSGTFLSKHYLHTNVDLPMEHGSFHYKIPMIDKFYLESLLEKHEISGSGSFILVDLANEIKDVFIDKSYEKIVYLDTKFLEIDKENAQYAFFLSVEPGNTLLGLSLKSGQRIEKIIHSIESEVFYEMSLFLESRLSDIELFKINPLSTQDNKLEIESNQIKYFNTDQSPSKVGFNQFELNVALTTVGSRYYLELNHLSTTLYFGNKESNKLLVPSEFFIGDILAAHEISTLDNLCMVQLNLSKPISGIKSYGSTIRGPMDIRVSFLDSDGLFSEEANVTSNFAFLRGDHQGVMSVKINYIDNTSETLTTFCSEGTYLVEQL